jgi:hypothetical protein
MARDSIVPTDGGVHAIKFSSEHVEDLVSQARAADEAEQKLTVREAVKHYKTATFWAIILSTSLIMEGYDLVIVRNSRALDACLVILMCAGGRSTPSMAKRNFKNALELLYPVRQGRRQ